MNFYRRYQVRRETALVVAIRVQRGHHFRFKINTEAL